MNIGDIVVVVGTESLFKSLLGSYGIITEADESKVLVEFTARVGNSGSMSHTAYRTDLKSLGPLATNSHHYYPYCT